MSEATILITAAVLSKCRIVACSNKGIPRSGDKHYVCEQCNSLIEACLDIALPGKQAAQKAKQA